MPGIQDFTYTNWATEATRGTPVAPTRKFYGDGTGVLGVDPSLSFHEAENRGVRTPIARATQTGEDVTLKLKDAEGVGFDDLIWPISSLKGGLVFTGAGADRTVTWQPAMAAANSPNSATVDVGDDVQNWRVQYAMWRSFKISAARGELTKLEGELFGQRAIKGAKATPADNLSPRIPANLWTIKFAGTQAGLAGASIQTNLLVDWALAVDTGLVWHHYLDGNLYGSQHIETSIQAQLDLTIESTAFAVSEFYDKMLSQTLDFVRLKATGPALGGSNYSSSWDVPILWSDVQPMGSETDGVNEYKVSGKLAYDPTSGFSIQGVQVTSLTAMP